MITLPIWLFVILVTLSSIFLLVIVLVIIGYIRYCHYDNKRIEREINEKYGKK